MQFLRCFLIWVFQFIILQFTVEQRIGSLLSKVTGKEKFPDGMHVLAVDDDQTCLAILERLLRQCQYQVTTTTQARRALKLLRENKKKFDLVISDVEMPEMDGLRLLELINLELDIPVIMLSIHDSRELVVKGIAYGACDYLLKPARIQELKNIWQHVFRRKCNPRLFQFKSSSHGGQGTDQILRFNRRCQDHNENDEGEDGDDSGNDNDDLSNSKRPRVVWSTELHNKFVAAVDQLGMEKAVPKKILDLMDVEGLTRENVASHLQKYRLYLKRSSVTAEQANMYPAYGGNPSYLNSLESFRSLAGSGRLPNTGLSSYLPMFGSQLSGAAGLTLHGLSSSNLIQSSPNLSGSISTSGQIQPTVLPSNQNPSLIQGNPSSLKLDQSQLSKSMTQIGESSSISNPTAFGIPSDFQDKYATSSSSNNSLPGVSSNLSVLPRPTQAGAGFGNQSAIPLNPQPSIIGFSGSANLNLLNHGRSDENWQSSVQFSKLSSNTMSLSGAFTHNQLSPNNLTENISSSCPSINNDPIGFSFPNAVSAPIEGSRGDIQGKLGLIGNTVENVNFSGTYKWEDLKQDYNQYNHAFSTLQSPVPANGVGSTLAPDFGQNNMNVGASLIGQLHGAPQSVQQTHIGNLDTDTNMSTSDVYTPTQTQTQDEFTSSIYESFEDMMNRILKRGQNDSMFMDDDFNFNT